LRDTAPEHLRVIGLSGDNPYGGVVHLQPAGYAQQCPARAESGNERVQPLVLHVGDNLAGCGACVNLGIRFIFKLSAQEPAVFLCEFRGLIEHARSFLGRGRQYHPGTEETQHLAPFDTEAFGHRDDQRIALGRTDHRQSNARIAARCFHDGLAGLELAAALGIFDHGQRHTVFDRANRVE
jgi:hypothetical protein